MWNLLTYLTVFGGNSNDENQEFNGRAISTSVWTNLFSFDIKMNFF